MVGFVIAMRSLRGAESPELPADLLSVDAMLLAFAPIA